MPKKERDPGIDAIHETLIEFNMFAFATLKKVSSELFEELKTDYEEYMRVLREVMEEKYGDFKASDVDAKIPENKWLIYMRGFAEHLVQQKPMSAKDRKLARKQIQEAADRKARGQDVH